MYNESITLYQTYVFFLQKIVLMILLTNTIYNTTNTCCMIGHRFRTHENYDSLNAKLQKIVDNYNSNNSERQISYTIEKHLWYNEYTIGY